ncbi:MAG: ABC transporter substrate-binding protein [Thermomicrobiales bacterium]
MICSGSGSTSFERLTRHVASSAPAQSRRDLIRTSAVMSAATALAGGTAGISSASAQAPVRRYRAQDDIETDVAITIPFNPFGSAVTLDPHRAPNWGPFWVLLPHVWSGLLAFDELGAVVPDLAEAVVPNDTADVWTAALKQGLTFASGNPVTAQSFVDSWLRALDPQFPSPMASFMELVQGFDAYVAGESSEIGFSVLDESTIEITLSEPFSSFPASLATFVWAAVDLSVIDDPDEEEPLLAGASAGLWQFTEFVEGDRIVMTPNANTSEPPSPSITRVVWQIVDGPNADTLALDLYRSEAVVSVDVPASLVASIEGDEALATDLMTIDSHTSTVAIGMDFNQEPFGDVRARRAVAAAIDRQTWANEISMGEFVPATSLVPPVVALTSGYEPASLISFDPEVAAALLDEAGIDPDANLADIVYYQSASDSPDQIERHAALLAMIAENSGLVIRHDATLTSDQIAALQVDNGGRQFDVVWWWTVTDTAALVQTIGSPESPYMAGWFNWSPELEAVGDQAPGDAAGEFEELIDTANASTDQGGRNDAHRQAEQLLLDNAVYVPLGHWVQRYLQKPWLQGTRQGPWSGRIPVRFDVDVVVRGRTGN